MMISIDEDKCTQCGRCVDVCPSMIYTMHQDLIKVEFTEYCIFCGHCLSICPDAAIRHKKLDYAKFQDIHSEEIDPKRLYVTFRERRSIRNFKKKSVSRELLQELIDVTRYAPTASNSQNVEFLVLQSSAIPPFVARIREFYGNIAKMLEDSSIEDSTMVRRLRKWNHWLIMAEQGKDALFYDPPVIILAHAPSSDSLAPISVGYTICYLMLAAHVNGLGTVNIGYAVEAMRRKPEIAEELGIPEDNEVYAIISIGYPAVKFKRIPLRNNPSITWKSD